MIRALDRVVLASASPRRLALLQSLGLDVRVVASTYGEPDLPGRSPNETARVHAREKLRDVVAGGRFLDEVVVAADTVVDLDGVSFGKPRDRADATRMLSALSGRAHLVHTACALHVPGGGSAEICETTEVFFFALERDEIERYAASGQPMDKAGAYGIQGAGATLVERINGDFYTVMGFPLARFTRALRNLDFAVPIEKFA